MAGLPRPRRRFAEGPGTRPRARPEKPLVATIGARSEDRSAGAAGMLLTANAEAGVQTAESQDGVMRVIAPASYIQGQDPSPGAGTPLREWGVNTLCGAPAIAKRWLGHPTELVAAQGADPPVSPCGNREKPHL